MPSRPSPPSGDDASAGSLATPGPRPVTWPRGAAASCGSSARSPELTAHVTDLDTALHRICQLLREGFDYRLVAVGHVRDGVVVARVSHGVPVDRLPAMPLGSGIVGTAVAERRAILLPDVRLDPRYVVSVPEVETEIVVPIEVPGGVWGCLLAADTRRGTLSRDDVGLLEAVAHHIAAAIETVGLMRRLERQLELAEALRRVSADISSKLDLQVILAETVDQATTLFGADRAAIYRLAADGSFEAPVARGLSERYLGRVADLPSPSLPRLAMETGEALFATDYAADPRGTGVREAVIEEGFDTRRRGAARGRGAAARRPGPLPRPPATLVEPRAGGAQGPGRTGQHRHPERRHVRPDGALGGPAPVDPAARHPARPDDQRARDRHGHRGRAPAAHRLPQRARLPGGRRRLPAGRLAREHRRVHRRGRGRAPPQGRRGHHGLGRLARHRPVPARRERRRPGTDHRRHRHDRRVHAHRPHDLRAARHRRHRAFQARPAPVLVRRPPPARDLRLAGRPGDGQRRRHRAAACQVRGPRTPAPQPARAGAHDRVDLRLARSAHRPRRDRHAPVLPHPGRQHRHRQARPRGRRVRAGRRARRGRGRVPRSSPQAGRGRRRLGRGARRGPAHPRRAGRSARRPLRDHRPRGRLPHRRPAARPRGRGRRADPRAIGALGRRSPPRSSSSSSSSPPRPASRCRMPSCTPTSSSRHRPTA